MAPGGLGGLPVGVTRAQEVKATAKGGMTFWGLSPCPVVGSWPRIQVCRGHCVTLGKLLRPSLGLRAPLSNEGPFVYSAANLSPGLKGSPGPPSHSFFPRHPRPAFLPYFSAWSSMFSWSLNRGSTQVSGLHPFPAHTSVCTSGVVSLLLLAPHQLCFSLMHESSQPHSPSSALVLSQTLETQREISQEPTHLELTGG